jgi:hypothetical protein
MITPITFGAARYFSSIAARAAARFSGVPALAERDRRVSRFPEDFGWIHEFDALRFVSEGAANGRPG